MSHKQFHVSNSFSCFWTVKGNQQTRCKLKQMNMHNPHGKNISSLCAGTLYNQQLEKNNY